MAAELVKGTTTSGFAFAISMDVFNDMRFFEALTKADENAAQLPGLIRLLLGDVGKEKLYEHHATEDGRVPADKVMGDVLEIIQSVKQGKNS